MTDYRLQACRIVRASAIYDLAVSAPFATPWSFAWVHRQLDQVNTLLGGAPLPDFHPFHVLFACLMASVVLMWSVLRLADPQPRYGLYDGAARVLFTLWMAWALTRTGAPLLWMFIVPEAAWGLAQLGLFFLVGKADPLAQPGHQHHAHQQEDGDGRLWQRAEQQRVGVVGAHVGGNVGVGTVGIDLAGAEQQRQGGNQF